MHTAGRLQCYLRARCHDPLLPKSDVEAKFRQFMKEKHLKPLILNFAVHCGGGVLSLPNSELSEALTPYQTMYNP